MARFEAAAGTLEVGMTRRVPLLLFFLLLLVAPLPLPAADAEFRVELLTPVHEPRHSLRSGDMSEVKAGFPAVAFGLFSGDLAGVSGDNRWGLLLHFDHASWDSYGYSAASLLAAWRQSLAHSRTRNLFASLYVGPTWLTTQAYDTLNPLWSLTPTLEATFDSRGSMPLLLGVGYRACLYDDWRVFPFESGFEGHVGAIVRWW